MTVLKTKAENGAAGSGARSTGSLLAPAKALARRPYVGRGEQRVDRVEQRSDADILEPRPAKHRRELARDGGRAQRRAQLIVFQHALVEILLEQRVVRFGHGLAQTRARRFGAFLLLGVERLLAGFAAGFGIDERLHRQHVDHAVERELGTDRQGQRDRMRVERLLEIRHRVIEARAFAVQPRDEGDSRQTELVHLGPYFF